MNNRIISNLWDRTKVFVSRLWPASPTQELRLDTCNALDEISRIVEQRIVKRFPPGQGPEALVVIITDRGSRPTLGRHLLSDTFAQQLLGTVQQELGAMAPTAIYVSYQMGELPGVDIEFDLSPPAPFHLYLAGMRWQARRLQSPVRVGRGEIRNRLRGAHNDLVLDDNYPFVKRDAFDFVWNPGTRQWCLHVDDDARACLRVEREGVSRIMQHATMHLEHGDAVILIGGGGRLLRITYFAHESST